MPIFGKEGDLHTISYITGPQHVWLGVAFAERSEVKPSIVRRPPVTSCHHGEIDPARIVQAVMAGIKGSGRCVKRIEYVENDSPVYSLYEYCANLLAEHAAADGA